MKSALGALLFYDAAGRLIEYDTTVSTRFVYDGAQMAAEVANPSGTLIRRHVFGPGADEPLVTYEPGSASGPGGGGLSDKRYLHADERGSIIAISNASGQVTQINAYDDYGIPQGKTPAGAVITGGLATSNFGRFGYTGEAWLPEVGLYHYKARAYSPTMGRFMQTDPIGYGDGVNLYAYVGGDPINRVDPSGLTATTGNTDDEEGEFKDQIVVTGTRDKPIRSAPISSGGLPRIFGRGSFPSLSKLEQEPEEMTQEEEVKFQCPKVPARHPAGGLGTLAKGLMRQQRLA